MLKIARTMLIAASVVTLTASMAAASWTASMSGNVVNVQTLKPVADARIRLYPENSDRLAGEATTDANGGFVISGLQGGQYRIAFAKSGYQNTMMSGILVRPGERFIEAAPIAMYPNGVKLPSVAMRHNPCGSLISPTETSDVYIVCSE